MRPFSGYDYIILDSPPGLGILSYMTLVACTRAVIVTTPTYYAYRALPMDLESIGQAKAYHETFNY